MTDDRPVGALAPFQSRIFTLLWLGVVLSSVGSWAQTVGAQWISLGMTGIGKVNRSLRAHRPPNYSVTWSERRFPW